MSRARKDELKELASELLAKVGTIMTPASVATCETILDEEQWAYEGWCDRLLDPEAESNITRLKNLYFNQLVS